MKCGLRLCLLLLTVNLFAQESREVALQRELPKLQSDYFATPVKSLGPETPLAKEYYQLLNRYVRYATSNMHDWPAEPGAKYHKRDGHKEHDVRQNVTVALAYAVLSQYGDFSESVAGIPRAQVKADARALLRYIAVTHTNNFLPTGSQLPWGEHWQSAFWTHFVGEAAWLMWDDLPDDTKVMLARMIIYEADRFNTRPPDNGEWRDTKAEENAWNSEVIALAACMFQKHPHAKLWRERAIIYMANSYSTQADHQDNRMMDGRRVRDWVSTVCLHPDFTLENHGRVHPDYMGAFRLNLRNPILYRLGGLPVPAASFHHAMDTYHVLEHLTATNGPQFYINGQDWWPHRLENTLEFGALLSMLKGDRNAAFLERAALRTQQQMHSRFADGRLFDPREHNYPNPEEENMALYADMYLAHRLFGDGPKPVKAAAFQAQQSGTRIFDIGGFVTHRTPEKFVSFAWVNGVMGLIYPAEDTWFTSPYERGMVGSLKIKGVEDSGLKVEKHTVAKLNSGRGEGFAFVGRIARGEGKVEQRVAMISLPDAPVLYIERITARAAIDVEEVATATFAVLNEEDKIFSRNERRIWTAAGEHVMRGAVADAAQQHVWNTASANVDGKLGVFAQASGRMSYRENHQYQRARLHQILCANYLVDVGVKQKGELVSEAVVGWLPNASPAAKLELKAEHVGPDGFEVRIGKWLVRVNLGDTKLDFKSAVLPALSAEVRRAR